MRIKNILFALTAAALAIPTVSCRNSGSSGSSSSETETASAAEDTSADEMTTTGETTDEADDEPTSEADSEDSTYDLSTLTAGEELSPAVWKVTDPATGNHIFLMGTVHITPQGNIDFPDYIEEAYNSCDSIAIEYDTRKLMTDLTAVQEFLSQLLYTDGTTIKDHLSPEAYEAAVESMKERGTYYPMIENYHVGFIITQTGSASMTDIKGLSIEGVDWKFAERADKDGKEIINIETIDTQADAITAMSDDYASYMILSSREQTASQAAEQYADIYNCWARGDIDSMIDVMEPSDDLPEELLDDHAEYLSIIVNERNKGMADAAESYIKDGKNCFFMVGALHFSGDRGVDDLLEEKGFTVERID